MQQSLIVEKPAMLPKTVFAFTTNSSFRDEFVENASPRSKALTEAYSRNDNQFKELVLLDPRNIVLFCPEDSISYVLHMN